MGIPKGTKLTDSPKEKMLRVRIDKSTEEKLEDLVRKLGLSKSEIVRRGIELQHGEIK